MKRSSIPLKMKAVAVSSGVVSAAVMLKLSLPVILDFLTSELPSLYSSAVSWLQPPFLYLLINCIILSIVASSKLQLRGPPEKLSGVIPMEEREDAALDAPDEAMFAYEGDGGENEDDKSTVMSSVSASDGDDEFVISRSSWTPAARREAVEHSSPVSSAEKPPVSSRFGHRKSVRSSPEGKSLLGVSRPKRHETLESTWRTITEGRPMPLKRHLRKADTFGGASEGSPPVRVMKKSETFAGGGNPSPASGVGGGSSGRLRREPSLSQDELNRRVEAFIKKFNEEMRLQRQESLNHYKEMVGGRIH